MSCVILQSGYNTMSLRVPARAIHAPPHFRAAGGVTSLNGYFNSSSLRMKCFLRLLVVTCSTINSRACVFIKPRINLGSQSSEAIPKSLQQRMSALDLQPSVAVGMPSGSKYCCSPRAREIRLVYLLAFELCRACVKCSYRPPQTRPYSLVTSLPVTIVSPRGASPHPPGPNALFKIRRYLISGR